MFISAKPSTVIDSVRLAEGSFKIPSGAVPEISLLMVYSNKGTGTTFGTCPMQAFRFSQNTLNLFQKFVESAETDFGALILEGGFIAEAEGRPSSMGMAESEGGLQQPRGIGGT